MNKLNKLGIIAGYDSENDRLNYSISIDYTEFSDPRGKERNYYNIVKAISKDAEKKGGLDNFTITADKKDLPKLRLVTRMLLDEAKKSKKFVDDFNNYNNSSFIEKVIMGCEIVGGVTGLYLSYPYMADWATNAGNYFNNKSHLLAPISGLTQLGISVMGTIATTIVGAIGGYISGVVVSSPYLIAKGTGSKKIKRYAILEEILSDKDVESSANLKNVGV